MVSKISLYHVIEEHRVVAASMKNPLELRQNTSNGNDIETNANESFDNVLFFDIVAKRTRSKVSKLFLLRNEPLGLKNLTYRSKAKHVTKKLNCESCEAKRTFSLLR